MKTLLNSKYTYGAVSLAIAIWLFISVSAPGSMSTRDTTSKQLRDNATKVTTVKNVQVHTMMDNDKYFVTGYPSTVNVKLKGPSALVKTTKITKNFTIYLNLNNLGVGKHKVEIKQRGINNQIKSEISPRFVTIDIQPRVDKVFPIQISFDKSVIKKGYNVGNPTASPDTVSVSGPEREVEKVAQVVAKVEINKDTKSDIDKEVLLQAVDSEGKIVNVVLSTQTTHINIPIKVPSKSVNVKIKQSGKVAGNNIYTLRPNLGSVRVYGNETMLSALSSIEVPVDISGVKSTTTKTISLMDILGKKAWDTDPKVIKVDILVEKKKTENTGKENSVTDKSDETTTKDTEDKSKDKDTDTNTNTDTNQKDETTDSNSSNTTNDGAKSQGNEE